MSTTDSETSSCDQYPMRADVYADTNTGELSILNRTCGHSMYGRVVDKQMAVHISDAEAIVYEGKRREAAQSKTKSVHAMFRGIVHPVHESYVGDAGLQIEYHVDRPGAFYVAGTDKRIRSAGGLWICGGENSEMYGLQVQTQPEYR